MIYINNESKLNNLKGMTNFYVITDFDRTLTTRNSEPSMGIIPQYIGGECLKKRTEIFEYYRPIELDYKISQDEKKQIMQEWAEKSFTLLSKYITEEIVSKSLENADIYLRDEVRDFFTIMKNKNIPVIVMSSGVGNIVKAFLEKEDCLFDNVEIVSNFFEFIDGKASMDFDNIMATLNKDYKRIPDNLRSKIEGKNALLFGDLIEDIRMANLENMPNTLTFGFLDENIEQNLERYKKSFDVVLTLGSDFSDVKNILNI